MFFKMLTNWLLALWLTAVVLAEGEFPGRLLRSPNKHHSSAHKARTQWAHREHEDPSHGQASEEISHGYATYQQGQTLGTAEVRSEYPTYSTSSVSEYWRPSSGNVTAPGVYDHGYSRVYSASTSGGGGSYHKDALLGSHSALQYRQVRPATIGQAAHKKILPHYLVGKFQIHNSGGSPKTKYKKNVPYQSPSASGTYKKPTLRPRVHKPYAKHKYPTHKTVHPLYRRYYQSPYQRYAIPFPDTLHNKLAHHKTSADSYHTTERMDDAYPDGSPSSDDYSNSSDTHRNATVNYYDGYEEPYRTPLSDSDSDSDPDPDSTSYDETTTRGYYGDRIYMSTHLPLRTSPDKSTTGNTYFILRRTSDDDDIQTIFE